MKTINYDNDLLNAIAKQDLAEIKGILISIIDLDPTDSNGIFSESLKFVENEIRQNNGSSIFYENDNFEEKKQVDWDKKYYFELKAKLSDKFSKKRIAMILRIGKVIYGDNLRRIYNNEGNDKLYTDSKKGGLINSYKDNVDINNVKKKLKRISLNLKYLFISFKNIRNQEDKEYFLGYMNKLLDVLKEQITKMQNEYEDKYN